MEIILLEKVENLGELGDLVKVRPGYARNFLVPQGKATEATAENKAAFEARRAELEREAAQRLAAAEARRDQLEGLELSIPANAGTEGKLFGSVGPAEVAAAASAAGVEVDRSEVRIEEPIRSTGEHQVGIHLHAGVDCTITVNVVPEA